LSHIPFGYIIKDGKAMINEKETVQIKELFQAYLSGLSLTEAGKKAGIKRCHASISKMLTDKRYVEDEFYPPIIDRDTFEKVQHEKHRRAEMLGRVFDHKENQPAYQCLKFSAPLLEKLYDDPFKQAEYAYSLIKSEVITDGK